MLSAIHKESGKFLGAKKLLTDPEWIGRTKEIFIAPTFEFVNYAELSEEEKEVIFIKESVNGRRPHFRKKSEKAIYNSFESPEHKKAKEDIYWLIAEGKLNINYNGKPQKLTTDLIDDITIEQDLGFRDVIADLVVYFKKVHEVLGEGIVVEIQLSKQSENKTNERTFQRNVKGFSTTWIFKDDLERFKQTKILNIIPFRKGVVDYQEQLNEEEIKRINLIGEDVNEKISELNKLNSYLNIKSRQFEQDTENFSKEIRTIKQEVISQINKDLKEEIKQELKPIIQDNKNNIIKKINEDIDNFIYDNLNEDLIREKIIEKYNENFEDIYDFQLKKLERELIGELNFKENELKNNFRIKLQEFLRENSKEITKQFQEEEIKELVEKQKSDLTRKWMEIRNKSYTYCKQIESWIEEEIKKAGDAYEKKRRLENGQETLC